MRGFADRRMCIRGRQYRLCGADRAACGRALFTGASHRRLLPLSLFMGAIFLMLADLLARTVVSPIELPIGVVTSLVGAVVFVVIFFRRRRLCWK